MLSTSIGRHFTQRLTYSTFSLNSYGHKMVHDEFDGTKGFAIDGGIKDSTHIRKLAAEKNSPMPALVGADYCI